MAKLGRSSPTSALRWLLLDLLTAFTRYVRVLSRRLLFVSLTSGRVQVTQEILQGLFRTAMQWPSVLNRST